jgi:hypothetical protein
MKPWLVPGWPLLNAIVAGRIGLHSSTESMINEVLVSGPIPRPATVINGVVLDRRVDAKKDDVYRIGRVRAV